MAASRWMSIASGTLAALLLLPGTAALAQTSRQLPPLLLFNNPSGMAATYSTAGRIDLRNPFFKVFGTNGRSCDTCHQASAGWSITPANVQARFRATGGTDPIFRSNDGSVSPTADVSTLAARRKAYAMLLTKGLIRVGLPIPDGAEFTLVGVDDPYGHASASDLSLFRRPLPATNLRFLSAVMWDGRETFRDPASKDCLTGTGICFASIHFDLADQANAATLGHAQALQALTQPEREAIIDFEASLYTAQVYDDAAGRLTSRGALGGPVHLSTVPFHFGINDVLAGDYVTGAPFDPKVFTLYASWDVVGHHAPDPGERIDRSEARAAVARGERLFDTKPIVITGVKGLNDDLGAPTIAGTCTTCHDSPNAGDHSTPVPLDIGTADASRRSRDLPLYTLQNNVTGDTVQTTDPGRALVSGKWKDIGRFKGPVLRGLASRAPYFHNGFAKDLEAVVDFYDTRFGIGFTQQEKDDLVAFLKTL